MCCFLLQEIEINTRTKPNTLVPTAAAPGDLWHRCVGPGVPERGSKLPGFYLKPMARLLRSVESGVALDPLSPCPSSPLYFRHPINKAGCNKSLSTCKTHPLERLFLGQGCDKGFEYRKPQGELNSKGTSGRSYMSNGLSVPQTRDGVDGTHPYNDVAQVSVRRAGDGAVLLPAPCQVWCLTGDTLGSTSLSEVLIPQGFGAGTRG